MGEKPEDPSARKAGTVVRDEALVSTGEAPDEGLRGGSPADPGGPAEATNLNSSKSNTARIGGPPGTGTVEPAEATNLNSSRSNIYRAGAPGAGEGYPPDAEAPGSTPARPAP